jgi:hypothetical protein
VFWLNELNIGAVDLKMKHRLLYFILKQKKEIMIALKTVYFANIIVAGWISITSLFYPQKANDRF